MATDHTMEKSTSCKKYMAIVHVLFFRKKCNLYICFWMNEIECLMAKYSICVIVHVCASEYAFVYVSVNTNEPNCKTSILVYF